MFTYKILRKFSTISTFKPSLLQTVNIHTIFKGNYNNINIHYSYKKAKRKSKCELNSKFSKTRGSPYSCEEQNKVLIPATWKLWERLRNVQTVNFCKSGYRYQSHLSHMLSCGKCLNGIKHKCFSPSAILKAHASYFWHIIYNISRVIIWCWSNQNRIIRCKYQERNNHEYGRENENKKFLSRIGLLSNWLVVVDIFWEDARYEKDM